MTRILIVDDLQPNREYLCSLLGASGYQVSQAADGVEALERARRERPEAIIADVLMPTMDGYEFVRRLRAEPAVAGTPVVFCTAVYHDNEVRRLAERCGVRHVLTKPCEPADVLRVLSDALRHAAAVPSQPDPELFHHDHLRLVSDKLTQTIEELGLSNERFGALIDINLKLVSERDPQRLLDDLCPAARNLIGARHVVLAVGEREDPRVSYFVTAGIDAATADALVLTRLDQGELGKVYREHRPMRIEAQAAGPDDLGLPAGYPNPEALLAAPIVSLKHVYGWICLSDRIGDGGFTGEDEKLLTILAAQVGRIYENDKLYKDIQESEKKFRQLAENIDEVFFLVEPGFKRTLYVSPTYEKIWGRNTDALYTTPLEWTSALHPEDRERTLAALENELATGELDQEFRILRPDGAERWIHFRGFPIYDELGRIFRIAGTAEDVTQRRLAAEKIQRLNRIHAVLSGINSTIVRIRERQTLFTEACRILVEHGCFTLAWIGLLDEESQVVVPAAWNGPRSDVALLSRARFPTAAGTPGTATTVGEAIRGRRRADSESLSSQDDPNGFFVELARRGYQRCVALALLSDSACVGVLVLCFRDLRAFDDQESRLLTELSRDISFALDYISKEERIEYLAYHDPLTGLANRTALYERLAFLIDHAGSEPRTFALVLLNINNFRDVNDTLGHHNGDRLLQEIARRIDETLFESDTAACLGGDEFAILLPWLARDSDVSHVVDKLRRALNREFVIENLPVNVEARLGVAVYPAHGDSADLLWQRADIALRSARDLQREWALYGPEVDHFDPARLTLIGGLRQAMDYNELVLHYQPMIELKTGRIRGVEGLVRWQHPDKGLLYPDEFIPLVERTSLVNPLTTWVLTNALRQGKVWHRNGLPIDVSVNISVRNLQNPDLCKDLLELARSCRFPVAQIGLEITESAIMAEPDNARRVLWELREAGIWLAVDDFGTGYSSLSYVRNLPVRNIKIDKSFVIDLNQPGHAAIISTAVDLGHNLGLTVTAEGVEDEQTCRILRDLGCDIAQGYYFTRPLPVDDITAWLRRFSGRDMTG